MCHGLGAIAFNQLNCIDRLLCLLVHTQQPMFKTMTIELLGYDNLPAGQNATGDFESLGI